MTTATNNSNNSVKQPPNEEHDGEAVVSVFPQRSSQHSKHGSDGNGLRRRHPMGPFIRPTTTVRSGPASARASQTSSHLRAFALRRLLCRSRCRCRALSPFGATSWVAYVYACTPSHVAVGGFSAGRTITLCVPSSRPSWPSFPSWTFRRPLSAKALPAPIRASATCTTRPTCSTTPART
jgi:hypothetical protein